MQRSTFTGKRRGAGVEPPCSIRLRQSTSCTFSMENKLMLQQQCQKSFQVFQYVPYFIGCDMMTFLLLVKKGAEATAHKPQGQDDVVFLRLPKLLEDSISAHVVLKRKPF